MSTEDQTPLVAQLAQLFSGLPRAYGTYELFKRAEGGKKLTGKAKTVRGEVTITLWQQHVAGVKGLGIVPIRDDGTCMFGAIDVDKYNVNINAVEEQVKNLRLPLLPTRTKSGGLHLYLFAGTPIAAPILRTKLGEWATLLGFGGSEIFPKQDAMLSEKDFGNWINMPYFGWDTGHTDRYGVFRGNPLTLSEYVARAELLKVTEEGLKEIQPEKRASATNGDPFLEGPPCLQSMAIKGFPAGTRNISLFAVGVYLKKRFPNEWQELLREYNIKFMKPPLPDDEVKPIIRSLNRKEYNYTCDKFPLSNFCNRNVCKTRTHGVGQGGADWNVVIDSGGLKILTDPPYWILTVNGKRVQVTSEDYLTQRNFVRKCIDALGYKPPLLKADKWDAIVNKILQESIEVEAPADASSAGELQFYLTQFITVLPQAETREEILTGKPFTEEGFTHFRAADFKKYLESMHFRALPGNKLYAQLKEFGIAHKQYWVVNQNINVWFIPAIEKEQVVVPARTIGEKGEM
jgi:hypothetical protein